MKVAVILCVQHQTAAAQACGGEPLKNVRTKWDCGCGDYRDADFGRKKTKQAIT